MSSEDPTAAKWLRYASIIFQVLVLIPLFLALLALQGWEFYAMWWWGLNQGWDVTTILLIVAFSAFSLFWIWQICSVLRQVWQLVFHREEFNPLTPRATGIGAWLLRKLLRSEARPEKQ